MIDFHSHIIPAIDDGARELKEALEMLEEVVPVLMELYLHHIIWKIIMR